MRNLFRAVFITVAAALLLLVVVVGIAQAQSLLSTGYAYSRPGTTVEYYNYVLPRAEYAPMLPGSVYRFYRITSDPCVTPLNPLARIELRRETRRAERLAVPARKGVW